MEATIMARGWAVIWHKHHRGLLVFLVGTLLLTMIQIASMYSWAGKESLPEFVKHISSSGTSPFSAVWWLILLIVFMGGDASALQKELSAIGLTDQQRWRLMSVFAAALAVWSATLAIADRTLTYLYYTDTVTAPWPLPLLGVTAWLIHFGYYWLAALLCLRAVQWPERWIQYLAYCLIGWITVLLLISFFPATNMIRYQATTFLNRTPILVLIVEFSAIAVLSWRIQAHPLPVKQDRLFHKVPKPM
jgi:hypothetical protein